MYYFFLAYGELLLGVFSISTIYIYTTPARVKCLFLQIYFYKGTTNILFCKPPVDYVDVFRERIPAAIFQITSVYD